MPDDVQGSDKGTDAGKAPGSDKGTELTPEQVEESKLLENPKVKELLQKEADRRVNQALEKERRNSTEREKAARDKAIREAEERKLLDDGKLKELADLKAKEAEEAKAELESYKRQGNIDALLDKEQVLDPELRAVIKQLPGDLAQIKEHTDKLKGLIGKAVEAEVQKRLGNNPPPKGRDSQDLGRPTKLSDIKTAADKSAFISKYGIEEFTKLVNAGQ